MPGARRPKSKLAAANPLTLLELQVGGSSSLQKVRQFKVLRSYSNLGQQLEVLSAAQALAELSLLLVASNDPLPGLLNTVLVHLDRFEELNHDSSQDPVKTLARSVQSCVHLLALGGYGIPVQNCCRSGSPLNPPIGEWDWRCSLIPQEGFAIGAFSDAKIQLNPSELALLQSLLRPNLPRKKNGELLGPKEVWLRLLSIIDCCKQVR